VANTTYFSIPLPGEGSQDWSTRLNEALSALTENMVSMQKPASANIRIGDIAGNKYLLVSTSGVQFVGSVNHGLYESQNFVVQQGPDFPTDYAEGQLFVKEGVGLHIRLDGVWVLLGALDEAAIEGAGGITIGQLPPGVGGYIVSDGAGGLAQTPTASNGQAFVYDTSAPSGWAARNAFQFLGSQLNTNEIPLGTSTDATAIPPGAVGSIFRFGSSTPEWQALSTAFRDLVPSYGDLVLGGTSAAETLSHPGTAGRLLVSDLSSETGARWAQPNEILPESVATAATNLYFYSNFI
jgi:hypothetical protein